MRLRMRSRLNQPKMQNRMQFRSSFQANMIRLKVCALELSVRPMTGMPAMFIFACLD